MIKDRLKTREPNSKLIEIQLLECILLILLFVLSYDITGELIYNSFSPFGIPDENLRHTIFIIMIAIIMIFYKYFDFLEQSHVEAVKKIASAAFIMNVAFIVLLYFASSIKMSAFYYLTAYAIQIVVLFTFKILTNFLRKKSVRSSINLIILDEITDINQVKSFKKMCKGKQMVVSYNNKNLKKYVNKADNIFLTGSVTKRLMNQVISYCTLKDKKVFIIPNIFEIAVKKSRIAYLGDVPIFTMDSFQLTEAQRLVKRLADIVFSILGIILAAPVFLLVVIGIKQEDAGPVFYKQVRSGYNGRQFEVIKFRSMVVDAERETGAIFAAKDDRRITKIGCIMRATRIDEIPQLFNVLTGSMSLVGPRPERPVFVEEFNRKFPQYHYRMSVKPGITGLAQVKGSYTTSVENKMKLDMMYIINYSIFLDIKIILETVKVVLKKEQASGFDEKEHSHRIRVKDSAVRDMERGM